MTVNQILTAVNDLEPNQYKQQDKIDWLNQLDGQVFDELVLTHVHDEDAEFTPHSATTDDLLIPEPYAREIYVAYLMAMIAFHNHENVKYNGNMTMFNTAYQEYAAYYNRKYVPLPACSRFYF